MARALARRAFADNRRLVKIDPDPELDTDDARRQFLDALADAARAGALRLAVLAKPRRDDGDLKTVRVRAIDLRGEPSLSFVHRHATRDLTRNHPLEAGLGEVAALLDPDGEPAFAQALLRTATKELSWLASRKGRQTLSRRSLGADEASPQPADAGLPASSAHDRAKHRVLPLDLPFLVDLGITDAAHRLVPSMARKWKQLDKFLDVLDPALDAAMASSTWPADARLRVVDYGSGKGYLTFAVHEHLKRRFGRAPEVTGVELRPALVELCNGIAARHGMEGLTFVVGDLRSVEPQAVDVMIALHACDTATDHALDLGLRAGARILVSSPCCHQELRPQMQARGPLAGMLRHGIHLGQEAEMVTDSLRALLLESAGYEAKVFEFIALEHTGKNKMILATRRGDTVDPSRALAQVDELKRFYGIREQRLETLLKQRAAARLTSS